MLFLVVFVVQSIVIVLFLWSIDRHLLPNRMISVIESVVVTSLSLSLMHPCACAMVQMIVSVCVSFIIFYDYLMFYVLSIT